MKSTGIVRYLDSIGRIVIPMELRKTLDIGEKDFIEIYRDGDWIIVSKYFQGCALCRSVEKLLIPENGKPVCDECINSLRRAQLSNRGSMGEDEAERD